MTTWSPESPSPFVESLKNLRQEIKDDLAQIGWKEPEPVKGEVEESEASHA